MLRFTTYLLVSLAWLPCSERGGVSMPAARSGPLKKNPEASPLPGVLAAAGPGEPDPGCVAVTRLRLRYLFTVCTLLMPRPYALVELWQNRHCSDFARALVRVACRSKRRWTPCAPSHLGAVVPSASWQAKQTAAIGEITSVVPAAAWSRRWPREAEARAVVDVLRDVGRVRDP